MDRSKASMGWVRCLMAGCWPSEWFDPFNFKFDTLDRTWLNKIRGLGPKKKPQFVPQFSAIRPQFSAIRCNFQNLVRFTFLDPRNARKLHPIIGKLHPIIGKFHKFSEICQIWPIWDWNCKKTLNFPIQRVQTDPRACKKILGTSYGHQSLLVVRDPSTRDNTPWKKCRRSTGIIWFGWTDSCFLAAKPNICSTCDFLCSPQYV